MSKKEKPVHIVCILDRSGSMGRLQEEVINSFNEFIKKQQKEEGKAKVTLVLFDDQYDVVYNKIKLKNVPELTSELYFARGMTALNDAIGKTLNSFIKKKDVIVLIQTDGHENASQEYTQDQIKKLVKKKTKDGWDFNFLGANIDAKQAGSSYGVHQNKSTQFDATFRGVRNAYAIMDDVTKIYRASKTTTKTSS